MSTAQYLTALSVLLVSAVAAADTHVDSTRRMVLSLPTFKEDRDSVAKATQLEAITEAVATVSEKPPGGISRRDWAALLVTVAYHESGLSERVMRGDFKPHEADAHMVNGVRVHRARGLWQNHRNSLNAELWERANGDVEAQAKMADRGLRGAFWTCARSGVPWLRATLNAYGGTRCGAQWPGLDKRVATFERLVAR